MDPATRSSSLILCNATHDLFTGNSRNAFIDRCYLEANSTKISFITVRDQSVNRGTSLLLPSFLHFIILTFKYCKYRNSDFYFIYIVKVFKISNKIKLTYLTRCISDNKVRLHNAY